MIIIRRSSGSWSWAYVGPAGRGVRDFDGWYDTVAHAWRDAMVWHGSSTPVLIYTR